MRRIAPVLQPGKRRLGHARGRTALLGGLLVFGLVGTACAPQSVVMVGDTPAPPPQVIPTVSLQVKDDRGAPLDGAIVQVGEQTFQTDPQGMAKLEWGGENLAVAIEAPGFFPGAVAVEEYRDEPFELFLRPVRLRGQVIDSSGYGLGGASLTLNDVMVSANETGRFEVVGATQGTITATRPGWHPSEVEWDGESLVTEIIMEPRVIKALHIAANIPGDPAQWRDMLDVAATTVVNSFVIDVKNETGNIFYNSQVEQASAVGAIREWFTLEQVVADMDAAGLYKIARLVTFQDPIAAVADQEIAIFDTATGGPFNKRGQYFLDPTDIRARAYALDLAEEVCAAGFDEIQFDYVRFPDGYPSTVVFDLGANAEERALTIATFLEEAGERLHPMGCAVAADIFGFITSVPDDGGIGQKFDVLSETVDVLSPMVYPSHYSTGWFGYNDPNAHPGPVVSSALDDGMRQLAGPALVRPWLQDFYYNADQVRAQIEAAEQRSLGWMLWNAFSRFQWDALEPVPLEEPTSLTPATETDPPDQPAAAPATG